MTNAAYAGHEHTLRRWLGGLGRRRQARLRLFCFAYAGGSSGVYRSWQSAPWPDVEVVTVELPGRGQRSHEAPFTQMPTLMAELVPALRGALDLPYVLFGYSLGALVAYDLAARLVERGARAPELLGVAACRPPHQHGRANWHRSPDPELLRLSTELGREVGGELWNPELLRRRLPLLRADLELCERYDWPGWPALPCPIAAYAAERDELAPRQDVQAWRRYTRASFLSQVFEGGHFFLLTGARARLERVLGRELATIVHRLRSTQLPGTVQHAASNHP